MEAKTQNEYDNIETLLSSGPAPYKTTPAERAFKFLSPFLKYVFNLKPAIPNLIYMAISIIGMQLLNIQALMPEDAEWMPQVLFWGLFCSIGLQIVFASTKSVSVPVITVMVASFCIWLQTTHGVTMPISKEILQYLACLGIFGVAVSSVFNH